MQVTQFLSLDTSTLKYTKHAGKTGFNALYLQRPLSFQLNDVEGQGWVTAPFGVSEPYRGSKKQSLAIHLTNEHLIGKFMELEALNKTVIKKHPAWFEGNAKEYEYKPMLTTLDDGRIIVRTKVNFSDGKLTKVWKATACSGGLMYTEGSAADITRDCMLSARFHFNGMWIQNKAIGMGLYVDEILVLPAAHEMEITSPTLNIPGLIGCGEMEEEEECKEA